MTDREFYGGLIHLHLLHHAAEVPHPARAGEEGISSRYRATTSAHRSTDVPAYAEWPTRSALEGAKRKVYELFGEMFFDGSGGS
jgi:hypothetical protein